MDRRWIGILIILIIGMGCMYFIVDHSNTVGNAVTVVKDVSVGVPPGFKIDDTSTNEAKLLNQNTNEHITINYIAKNPQKEFSKRITSFENKHNAEMKNLSNKTVQHIQFKDLDSKKLTSYVLFVKDNSTFIMKLSEYQDSAKIDENMNYIMNSMVHDFKQNK